MAPVPYRITVHNIEGCISYKRLQRTHVPQLAIGGLCAGGAALRPRLSVH